MPPTDPSAAEAPAGPQRSPPFHDKRTPPSEWAPSATPPSPAGVEGAPFVWEHLPVPDETPATAAASHPLHELVPALNGLELTPLYYLDGRPSKLYCHVREVPCATLVVDRHDDVVRLVLPRRTEVAGPAGGGGSSNSQTKWRPSAATGTGVHSALNDRTDTGSATCTTWEVDRWPWTEAAWSKLLARATPASALQLRLFPWAGRFYLAHADSRATAAETVLQECSDGSWRTGALEELRRFAAAHGHAMSVALVKESRGAAVALDVVDWWRWAPRLRVAYDLVGGVREEEQQQQQLDVTRARRSTGSTVNLFGGFPTARTTPSRQLTNDNARGPSGLTPAGVGKNAVVAYLCELCGDSRLDDVLQMLNRVVLGKGPPTVLVAAAAAQCSALWTLFGQVLGAERCQADAALPSDICANTLLVRLQPAQLAFFARHLAVDTQCPGDVRLPAKRNPVCVRRLSTCATLQCAVRRQVVSVLVLGKPGASPQKQRASGRAGKLSESVTGTAAKLAPERAGKLSETGTGTPAKLAPERAATITLERPPGDVEAPRVFAVEELAAFLEIVRNLDSGAHDLEQYRAVAAPDVAAVSEPEAGGGAVLTPEVFRGAFLPWLLGQDVANADSKHTSAAAELKAALEAWCAEHGYAARWPLPATLKELVAAARQGSVRCRSEGGDIRAFMRRDAGGHSWWMDADAAVGVLSNSSSKRSADGAFDLGDAASNKLKHARSMEQEHEQGQT